MRTSLIISILILASFSSAGQNNNANSQGQDASKQDPKALNAKIDSLNSVIFKLRSDNTKLELENTRIKGENSRLKSDLDIIEKVVNSSLTKEINNTRSDLETTKKQLAAEQKEKNSLKTKNQELTDLSGKYNEKTFSELKKKYDVSTIQMMNTRLELRYIERACNDLLKAYDGISDPELKKDYKYVYDQLSSYKQANADIISLLNRKTADILSSDDITVISKALYTITNFYFKDEYKYYQEQYEKPNKNIAHLDAVINELIELEKYSKSFTDNSGNAGIKERFRAIYSKLTKETPPEKAPEAK